MRALGAPLRGVHGLLRSRGFTVSSTPRAGPPSRLCAHWGNGLHAFSPSVLGLSGALPAAASARLRISPRALTRASPFSTSRSTRSLNCTVRLYRDPTLYALPALVHPQAFRSPDLCTLYAAKRQRLPYALSPFNSRNGLGSGARRARSSVPCSSVPC